jgi:GNAT superfamily N-acetyltransferase
MSESLAPQEIEEQKKKAIAELERARAIADAMGISKKVRHRYPSVLPLEKNNAYATLIFGEFDASIVIVSGVFVDKQHRRHGAGTALMRDIVALADQIPIRLGLETRGEIDDPLLRDQHIPTSKLAAWYRSFGFFGSATILIREPK